MSPSPRADFLLSHVALPLLLLTLASALITLFDIDRQLADALYAWQGGAWIWRDAWLTDQLLHQGARQLIKILGALIMLAFLVSLAVPRWRRHRGSLGFLVLALFGGTAIVSSLKHALGTSCPWEFARYGGGLDYHSVLQQLVLRDGRGCFPAGHASAGYAWVAVYFLGLRHEADWRHRALAGALLVGLIFGITQQVRGAHFLSHDVWTLAVCWFWSASLYLLFFHRAARPLPEFRHEFA
jgi:membrane-associated PAP2 superfamily phosphatase